MSDDLYLRQVLQRYAIDQGLYSPVRAVQTALWPVLKQWGGRFILDVKPSGSFAKGTAVHGGTDIDIFVSLTSTLTDSLKSIYATLHNALAQAGYSPRPQNVSLGIVSGGYKVDVTPGRRQDQHGRYHSLHSHRTGSWMQTNIDEHVQVVGGSGRTDEIRLMKIWRNRFGLDWPSFYLELFVIDVLHGERTNDLPSNIVTVLTAVRDTLSTRRLIDPANTNNVLSDTLTAAGKNLVVRQAAIALQGAWDQAFA